ncbi:hypothetical protein, partial [Nocardioides sp.]|uniref:hypothetical protein n=1 Tax=Nocardioides sp. TaxID=35761 RepID=UPI00273374FB
MGTRARNLRRAGGRRSRPAPLAAGVEAGALRLGAGRTRGTRYAATVRRGAAPADDRTLDHHHPSTTRRKIPMPRPITLFTGQWADL